MFELEQINITTKRIIALQEEGNQDVFLHQIVETIAESSSLLFVGIYLVDENKKMVIFEAGSGEVGDILKKRGHCVVIGENRKSVFQAGTSVYLNEVRLINWLRRDIWGYKTVNVSHYEVYSEKIVSIGSPLLPLSRAELFVPLRVDGKAIGVLELNLDVLLPELSKDEVLALQSMADQIAEIFTSGG